MEYMIGKKFNKWEVLETSHNYKGNYYYKCKCDCGKISIVKGSNLRHDISKQCKKCHAKQAGRLGLNPQGKNSGLYFIRCGEYVKIGTSNNVIERIRTLQVSSPHEYELIAFHEGKGSLESYLHEMFKDKHHRGEWFHIPDDKDLLLKL